jgi:hypothetical protein
MMDRVAEMIMPFRGVKLILRTHDRRTHDSFRAGPIFGVEAENALSPFVYNFAFACPG